MFSESESDYIGKILKKLSAGKTLKHLLLEATWPERAKMLSKLKQIRRAHSDFLSIIGDDEESKK